MTTVNFPDVMLPYFSESRGASIFFISFTVINTILVINMVLAVFYTSYKAEVERTTINMIRRKNSELLDKLS